MAEEGAQHSGARIRANDTTKSCGGQSTRRDAPEILLVSSKGEIETRVRRQVNPTEILERIMLRCGIDVKILIRDTECYEVRFCQLTGLGNLNENLGSHYRIQLSTLSRSRGTTRRYKFRRPCRLIEALTDN